jgi:hypothetical protein
MRREFRVDFSPVGEYGGAGGGQKATQVDEVRVFFASAPEGFSLKENELKVLTGYRHRILGKLKVIGAKQHPQCWDYPDPEERKWYEDVFDYAGGLRPDKKTMLVFLKERAKEVGANAIIYVYSELPDESSDAACKKGHATDDYAGAWAVSLIE